MYIKYSAGWLIQFIIFGCNSKGTLHRPIYDYPGFKLSYITCIRSVVITFILTYLLGRHRIQPIFFFISHAHVMTGASIRARTAYT